MRCTTAGRKAALHPRQVAATTGVIAMILVGLGMGQNSLAQRDSGTIGGAPQRAAREANSADRRAQTPIAPPRVPQRQNGSSQNGSTPLIMPDWADKLTPEHEIYLNEILSYWEFRSNKIKVFKCDFTRWRYDPVFVAADPETGKLPAKQITSGVIRYERPDKALYKDEKVFVFQAPKKKGGKAGYIELPEDSGDHWICNGEAVFEFDYGRKQLLETQLPPEYRGTKIVENGPLPFLFGAKADKIKKRYWLRVITPDKAEGEYWIEAYPKHQEDASNFKMLHIIIDEKDYLPKALIMFNRNFDAVRNPARTTFEFKNRIVNPTLDQLKKLDPLHRDFHDPKTPTDWEKVVKPYRGRESTPGETPATARPGAPEVRR